MATYNAISHDPAWAAQANRAMANRDRLNIPWHLDADQKITRLLADDIKAGYTTAFELTVLKGWTVAQMQKYLDAARDLIRKGF